MSSAASTEDDEGFVTSAAGPAPKKERLCSNNEQWKQKYDTHGEENK